VALARAQPRGRRRQGLSIAIGERLVVALVIGSLIGSLAFLVWHENERRYDAFAMTGCFGDSADSPLGASQNCTGARRLCRDAPPLIDWRRYCR
jgi:hypothetical protein